jgi:prepilin-type processing-associated H-X9-DG protein
MFRAAELHHLRTWAVRRPVLDLGCGDGLFAANCLNGRLDVGLDCSPSRLARARAVGGHLSLVQADAGEMPFPQWENTWSFRSRHPGGIQFAFADGSTRFVNDSISLAVYRTLATMNGGEVGTFY